MKLYPALDVRGAGDPDLVIADVDDFSPTAVEPRDPALRIFFATSTARDGARAALAPRFDVTPIEVPDEDWARRSQQGLQPVTVGSVTVRPNAESQIPNPDSPANPESQIPNPISIVVIPSMGFGTGHHATTRLCLEALQAIELRNRTLLDVGTGSGVLAIAAARLGATRAVGIDSDPDAIQSARENLALNPEARNVTFDAVDLTEATLPSADVVTANLTGALLIRAAAALAAAVRPGGTLILSGLLAHERDEVSRAFAPASVLWEREDEGWIGLAVKK